MRGAHRLLRPRLCWGGLCGCFSYRVVGSRKKGQAGSDYREKEERTILQIKESLEKYGKTMALLWQGRGLAPDASSLLRRGKILAFCSVQRTISVIQKLAWYRQYLDSISGE